MTIIKKLSEAKAQIKATKLKKEGRNDFSKFDYFTPAQVEYLVADACHKLGLLTKFDLVRDALGVYGVLTVYEVETEENMEFTMATAIPTITATNIAQQLGGCVTYTERYLKMSAFGITDNKLDFDTTENTAAESSKRANDKAVAQTIAAQPEPEPLNWKKVSGKPMLTDALLTKAILRAKSGEDVWPLVLETYEVTPEQESAFVKAINNHLK